MARCCILHRKTVIVPYNAEEARCPAGGLPPLCSAPDSSLYNAECVPVSGGASRAAAARVLSRGKHSRIHGTWDMGHSSIISLCRVEQSGGEWSGVDSEDSEDAVISHQHITDTGLEHRRGMGSRVRCRLSLQAMNMNKEWKQQA